ncbi:hypothetical protein XELAEV_18047588mg [Xenopus laevis]|uniref:Uncharacterized protein n=1 Tax=Xenopus laevis TaxID=8355 RepID=A0A974H217_XENLA|nr:hypothetical protein XELAEV_18047588mg [Xenopus laevis]
MAFKGRVTFGNIYFLINTVYIERERHFIVELPYGRSNFQKEFSKTAVRHRISYTLCSNTYWKKLQYS